MCGYSSGPGFLRPRTPFLKIALDIARKLHGHPSGGRIVRKLLPDLIPMGIAAVDMEKVTRHMLETAAHENCFVDCPPQVTLILCLDCPHNFIEYPLDQSKRGGDQTRTIRGRLEDDAIFTASPNSSDGTGHEPAIAIRAVRRNARAALILRDERFAIFPAEYGLKPKRLKLYARLEWRTSDIHAFSVDTR